MRETALIKAGIINVTGYAGIELARILYNHPAIDIKSVTGRSQAGTPLREIFPHLLPFDLEITEEITGNLDVVFSALPHVASAEKIAPLINQGIKVIDISADFRLEQTSDYKNWYDFDHSYPELLSKAVYGLPEIRPEKISNASLIANPGCYPTAAILAMAPVIKEGLIEPEIIVDAKSGVSGAGRKASIQNLYSEINENLKAYSVNGHRHLPEITQELSLLNTNISPQITFVPHLVPMTRGILATCYGKLKMDSFTKTNKTREYLKEIYQEFYRNAPFTNISDAPPETKHTQGNNDCLIYPTTDVSGQKLIVISCIDNLVKGAAGQAVQNMNIMFGLPENEGLKQLSLYP